MKTIVQEMKVPLINLKRQHNTLRKEIDGAIKETIDTNQFILGKTVATFEKEIAQYLNIKHTLGVASGSDALLLALMAYDIKAGDEVITTPFTFFATIGAIIRLGAKPVFADIEEGTHNIDVTKIEEKITEKTKAIMPVHLFGQTAELGPIIKIAQEKNIKVIEDAAQAIGAEYEGKKVGTIGDVGCFSFFPTKTLSGFGDGGLIATNDTELYEKLKALRNHGSTQNYQHTHIGANSRLDAIQAAILSVKLPHVDNLIKEQRTVAQKYTEFLQGVVKTPENRHNATFNTYNIKTKKRDALKTFLQKKGIETKVYYPRAAHLQTCIDYLNHKEGDFPVAEESTKTILSLPIFPGIKNEEVVYVVESIKEFFQEEN